MLSFVLKVGIAVVAIYALLVLILFFFQSRFVYFPTRDLVSTPGDAGLSYEDILFVTSDGLRLHGWFVPSPQPRGVVLFFHGNGGNISHRLQSLSIFNRLGLSTFIFDYRGYGRSEGTPDEEGTYIDAEAAWNYLYHVRGEAPERIILFGRSLGGAVAAWLARKQQPMALILESTFTSIPDVGADHYPFLPLRILSRFRYNTVDHVQYVHCPVLVVHSPDDELVPFKHGSRLFNAAPYPKDLLTIAGGHNDGFVISGSMYEQGLNSFITTHEKHEAKEDE